MLLLFSFSQLASSSDDKTFRSEGLASARDADLKAFEDYTSWARHQETTTTTTNEGLYTDVELQSEEQLPEDSVTKNGD